MRRLAGIVRRQFIGVIALAIAVTGVANGAVPKFLELGASNDEPRTTLLRNTGPGSALELSVKATQPPLTVNSSKLVEKLNAALLGGKPATAFALVGAGYTKAQSNAKYAPVSGSPNYAAAGSSYTKAQSDAKYAPLSGSPNYAAAGSSYTKGESDAKYALGGASYTTSASDARYGRILFEGAWQATTPTNGAETVAIDPAVNVPGPGMVLIAYDIDPNLAVTTKARLYINGPQREELYDGMGTGNWWDLAEGFAAAGPLDVKIKVLNTNMVQASASGRLLIVFFPD